MGTHDFSCLMNKEPQAPVVRNLGLTDEEFRQHVSEPAGIALLFQSSFPHLTRGTAPKAELKTALVLGNLNWNASTFEVAQGLGVSMSTAGKYCRELAKLLEAACGVTLVCSNDRWGMPSEQDHAASMHQLQVLLESSLSKLQKAEKQMLSCEKTIPGFQGADVYKALISSSKQVLALKAA